jgi:hypothetical protein
VEIDNYQTRARNWLDQQHWKLQSVLAAHLVRCADPGWGVSLRSPMLWHSLQAHPVYANQIAQATSPIRGGLICPNPDDQTYPLYVPPGFSPVDHDQRNTLNVGVTATLPWHSFASGTCVTAPGL